MTQARIIAVGWWWLVAILSAGCSSLPSLDQQKQLVQQGDYRIHQLPPRAFVETWGEPTYTHQQFTHFFGMQDGQLIPQSRMALGESPQGWETGLTGAGIAPGSISGSPSSQGSGPVVPGSATGIA